MIELKPSFIKELTIYIDPISMEAFHLEEIRRIEEEDAFEQCLSFLDSLNAIDLSVEETCILLGLVLVVGSGYLRILYNLLDIQKYPLRDLFLFSFTISRWHCLFKSPNALSRLSHS